MLQLPETSQTRRPIALATADPVPSPSANPHPIYGRVPERFALEDQNIQTLAHWHRIALGIYNRLPYGSSQSAENSAAEEACKISRAIAAARPKTASGVATQLSAVIAHGDVFSADDVCISSKELAGIVGNLAAVTAPPEIKKQTGPLRRGFRLTRAGLLFRYHAFLINELKSVGLELYGSDEYALACTPLEDAVMKVCAKPTGRGKRHPFHDQSKLPHRARAVFKTIGIDDAIDAAPIRNKATGEVIREMKPSNGGPR